MCGVMYRWIMLWHAASAHVWDARLKSKNSGQGSGAGRDKVDKRKLTTDLSVDIAGIKLKNPVMTASGTFGYGEEFAPYLDLNRLGAVVVKGLSLKPRQGNPPPRIVQTAAGML